MRYIGSLVTGLGLAALYLRYALGRLTNEGRVTANDLTRYLDTSPWVTPRNGRMIGLGLAHYANRDFISAVRPLHERRRGCSAS